jgi:uncharacterized protein (DUF58 family)
MINKLNLWLSQREALSKTFWYVFICVFCSFLFLLFQGGKLALMLFMIVTILSVYLGLGRWSGIASSDGKRVLLNKTTSGDIDAGTAVQVKINVHIPGFWPIPYVIVKDTLERKNGRSYHYESTFIPDWKRKGEIVYTTSALRRGFYHFGQTVCSTEDIFGLFEHKGSLRLNETFRVLPQTVRIREWKQFHHMIRGIHHHSAATKSSRETTQIDGVREYVYGDRISRIHWKTTARTGTWKSKEFERESLPRTIIVLDRNQQAYQDADQFERAVSVAASLFQFGLGNDLALGLLSVGKDIAYFEAKRGHGHHKNMVNHLIEAEADGQYDLMDVLQKHPIYFSQGLFLLLITPQSDTTQILKMMAWLRQGQMTSCHLWMSPKQVSQEEKDGYQLLKSKGYYGYIVNSLQELPQVLGGRS